MKKIILISLIVISGVLAQEKVNKTQNIVRTNVKHFFSHAISVCTSFLYEDSTNNCNYISNHSSFRVYFDTVTDEDHHTFTSLSLRAKVKLPKISNKLFFTLDKESTQSKQSRENSEIRDLASDNNTRVGLKYYFKKTNTTSLYAKLGAKLRLSSKSDLYLKLGATNLLKFNNFDLYSYANEYYYIKANIFKTQLGTNIIKKLNDDFTLSLNNEIRLQTHEDPNLQNSLVLDQYIDKSSMISYWSTLSSSYNSSFHNNSISINIKYHKMINEWMFYEIQPSLVKSLRDDKKLNRYLHLNFGLIF